MYDPWTLLGAMALATSRVTLGAMVFAPTRRRPWKVAREAMTIDHLSRGRLVVPWGWARSMTSGFGNVGEATGNAERADILDETLSILDGLWSGEPFGHEGTRYRFGPMTFRPRPVQRPRIPIWVALRWPGERSMARALRWDGAILQTSDPGEVTDIVAHIRSRRAEDGSTRPYEVIAQGMTPPDPVAAARHRAALRRRGCDLVGRCRLGAGDPGQPPRQDRRRATPGILSGCPTPSSTSRRPSSGPSWSPSTPAMTPAGPPRIPCPSWPASRTRPVRRSWAPSGRTAATSTPTGTSARARPRSS